MNSVISIVIWLAASYLSRQYAAGYWVVGAVFGAALFLSNRDRVLKKINLQHLLLFAGSILVYALVYLIAAKGWRFQNDWLDMLTGSVTSGVIVGSVLMPVLQAMLLGGEMKVVRSVSLKLIASWYITLIFSKVLESVGIGTKIDFLWVSIAVWQGIYLKYLKL